MRVVKVDGGATYDVDPTRLACTPIFSKVIGRMLTAGRSESYAVTEKPPADSADRRVTDVLDEDVLGVLDRHRADLFRPRTMRQREPGGW